MKAALLMALLSWGGGGQGDYGTIIFRGEVRETVSLTITEEQVSMLASADGDYVQFRLTDAGVVARRPLAEALAKK